MRANRRYSGIVGVLFLLVAGIALFQTLGSGDSGTLGFEGDELSRLEPFAVPRVGTDLEGDANVNPSEACSITDPRALEICDFYDRPLLISFWFGSEGPCVEQQDVIDRINHRFGERAGVISINVRDDRNAVEELVAARGWSHLVGHDRDGAVSNLYRVGGCPTLLFADRGASVVEATIGPQSLNEVATKMRGLLGEE